MADLYAYFDEPWTAALFHDRFDCLRVENRAALLSRSVCSLLPSMYFYSHNDKYFSQGINGESLVDDIIKAFIANKWKEVGLEFFQNYSLRFYLCEFTVSVIRFKNNILMRFYVVCKTKFLSQIVHSSCS